MIKYRENSESARLINEGVGLVGQGNYQVAEKNFKLALKANPDSWVANYNLGIVCRYLNKVSEAVGYFRQANKLDTNNSKVLNDLGATFRQLGDFTKADKFFRKSIEADSKFSDPHYNLGLLMFEKGKFDLAKSNFKKAITIDPDNDKAITMLFLLVRPRCDWKLNKTLTDKLDQLTEKSLAASEFPGETPFANVTRKQSNKQAYLLAKVWSKETKYRVRGLGFRIQKRYKKGKKIRVGYVSDGFRDFPTGHNLVGIYKHHDKTKLDVYTYSYGVDDGSVYRKLFEKYSYRFRDVMDLDFLEIAKQIVQDKIDVLVDLKGFTREIRQEIFALKPASIIVNWLGYPGTTGATFMDYMLADKTVIPTDQKKYFSEKIINLPCYRPADMTTKPLKEKQYRSQFQIPKDAFVFSSLNGEYKIDEQVFEAWMIILKEVEDSVLLLQANEKETKNNLSSKAKKMGINPNRLIFIKYAKKPKYLAKIRDLVDLALDTTLVNGHTTTTDTLRMGVPVVTMVGKHFASRVSASVLKAVGLNELVANNMGDYKKLAIELANNPEKLAEIKTKLENNLDTSLSFSPKEFAKELENVYFSIVNYGN